MAIRRAIIAAGGYYCSGKPATMVYISTSQTSIITICDQLVSLNIAQNWFHLVLSNSGA